jgi:hypothetical protein
MQIATILLLYHKKFYKPDTFQTRICISFPDIENTTFFTESICEGSESISTTHAGRGIIISVKIFGIKETNGLNRRLIMFFSRGN